MPLASDRVAKLPNSDPRLIKIYLQSSTREDQGKVHVPKNRQEWKNSRKEFRDWVFKKCENVTTPEEKLASLKIWKKLNSKPRSPYWSPVAFEVDGQWYSVDVKKARNLIEEEMEG